MTSIPTITRLKSSWKAKPWINTATWWTSWPWRPTWKSWWRYYRDQTLNDLPEFAGLNPSIEHFARLLGQSLGGRIQEPLSAVTVKIWENDIAWAAYREER